MIGVFLLGRLILSRIGGLVREGRSLGSIRPDLVACTGQFKFRSHRSIWIHGGTPEAFLAADAAIASIRRIASESCLIMTTNAPQTEAWLRIRFPDDRVFPAPWPRREFAERFIRQTSPQMIILLQTADGFCPSAARIAQSEGIPMVLIDALGPSAAGKMPKAFSHICVQEEDTAISLKKMGEEAELITTTGRLAFEAALLASPGSSEYFCRELHLSPETRFVLAENIAMTEERDFSEIWAQLRVRHPNLVVLWKPTSVFQLRRFKARLDAMGLTARHWGDRSVADPAVVILDSATAAALYYGACSAVIAGGTFRRLVMQRRCTEPLTIHAPMVFGPYIPESAPAARELIHASGALQCPMEELAATLLKLLEGDVTAGLLASARQLMESCRGATAKTLHAISPFYPALPDEHPSGVRWRPKKTRAQREAGRNPAAGMEKVGLEDWEAFQARLGPCRSILCLGNGPTSESAAAIAAPHDCLFRANWRWKDRGILTNPNAIFVGDPATIGKLDLLSPFIFPDPEREFDALRSSRILGRKAPIEYFTLTRSASSWLVEVAQDAHARPSNGALMVATAAALQPECLTIAGLDLFSHRDGRYPGDLQGANAYSQCHDSEYELVVIERALREYQGELIILSPILKDALQRRGFPASRLKISDFPSPDLLKHRAPEIVP